MARSVTYRVASNPSAFRKGELAILFAGESQTAPLHRIGPKVVDYYLLHHVVSGRGRFRIGGVRAGAPTGRQLSHLSGKIVSLCIRRRGSLGVSMGRIFWQRSRPASRRGGILPGTARISYGRGQGLPDGDAVPSSKRSGSEADPPR